MPAGIGEFLSELLEFHFPFLGGCGVAGETRCRQAAASKLLIAEGLVFMIVPGCVCFTKVKVMRFGR